MGQDELFGGWMLLAFFPILWEDAPCCRIMGQDA